MKAKTAPDAGMKRVPWRSCVVGGVAAGHHGGAGRTAAARGHDTITRRPRLRREGEARRILEDREIADAILVAHEVEDVARRRDEARAVADLQRAGEVRR